MLVVVVHVVNATRVVVMTVVAPPAAATTTLDQGAARGARTQQDKDDHLDTGESAQSQP